MDNTSPRPPLQRRLGDALGLAALYIGLNAAGVLARLIPRLPSRRRPPVADAPGLSILIPERGTPDLLEETLGALMTACADLREPTQVLVVVNGAPAEDYIALAARYPHIEWQFHGVALGYNGAIVAGLRATRHAWTYLLNSDMRLAPNALAELLPHRRDGVFAIASQIFFADASRRREETGWADFRWNSRTPEIYDRLPESDRVVRGSFYAGGGSSLFRTPLLRRYASESHDYAPFYWEDAEWGVRAWAEGWSVLFCPTSHAWHRHRSTVCRYYTHAEIERVIRRNALLFDLRHGWTRQRPAQLVREVAHADAHTRTELTRVGLAWRAFRMRLATRRAQRRGLRYDLLASRRYDTPLAIGDKIIFSTMQHSYDATARSHDRGVNLAAPLHATQGHAMQGHDA